MIADGRPEIAFTAYRTATNPVLAIVRDRSEFTYSPTTRPRT